MAEHMDGQLLFYGGVALLVIGALAGVTALALLILAHHRLKKQLTREYGNKRG